jgi:lysophospholipase L1-like esterase
MRTRFGRKVLFSALVSIGILVLAEGLLAVAGLPSTGIYAGNLVTEWRLKPDLNRAAQHVEEGVSFPVRTSSLGFRDGEIPADTPWVAAVGCSTTFGWGVNADRAWPELLEADLGVEVINAGIPGHSSHQGRAVALDLIAQKPDALILSWMVRDVQRAPIADKQAQAPKGLRSTRIFRWLAKRRRSPREASQNGVHRVAPKDFGLNYQEVIQAAFLENIPVLVVAFPMQDPSPDHLAVLKQLPVPMIAPDLASQHFFASDPIHLNPAGNLALAQALVSPLQSALGLIEAVD